jgi:hypothetical protein
VHPWGTGPCPPAGDTLSLLQPRASAYGGAPAFVELLRHHRCVVRCVTRTVFGGILGVGRAAALETDRGPISVLFFPRADHVRVQQLKTPSGTCYTFRNQPHPGIGDVLNINGPLHVVARGCWFILAPDAEVAAVLARRLAGT